VFNVDLGAGRGLNAADDLAARSDDVADLVRVNLDDVDSRGVGRQFSTGFGHGFLHLGKNVVPAAARLVQRVGHGRPGKTLHFRVHLEGGDAVLAAADLEVQVAQVIFIAQNVRQDADFVAFLDHAHGNA